MGSVRAALRVCSLLLPTHCDASLHSYTFFYVLYPLGAASEAQLMFSTLPKKWFWEAPSTWSLTNYVFLGLWCLWWPGKCSSALKLKRGTHTDPLLLFAQDSTSCTRT